MWEKIRRREKRGRGKGRRDREFCRHSAVVNTRHVSAISVAQMFDWLLAERVIPSEVPVAATIAGIVAVTVFLFHITAAIIVLILRHCRRKVQPRRRRYTQFTCF